MAHTSLEQPKAAEITQTIINILDHHAILTIPYHYEQNEHQTPVTFTKPKFLPSNIQHEINV
jgi:hypothetical protein